MSEPCVWSDEDGNYWGVGHIPTEEFVRLCETVGYDSQEGCYNGGLDPASIRHSWFRQHPKDQDRMLRCEADHPKAEAWTEWRR